MTIHGNTFGMRINRAFTLSEALITLGIIGVVAALTLPSLVNKYKLKQLEVAFKRNASIIENAANDTAAHFGYSSFKDMGLLCQTGESQCPEVNKDYFTEINNYFLSHFKIIKTIQGTDLYQFKYINYSGTAKNRGYNEIIAVSGYSNPVSPNSTIHLLADGTMVSNIGFFVHWLRHDGLTIAFDTNGPYKGPNRYGYDIFIYKTSPTVYSDCSSTDGLDVYQNGNGCYEHALSGKNPDDDTKGYWDSLEF